MYYYLLIAVKLYCLYHIYTTKRPYYWYFVIIFLPLLGCIVYFITQVYNKQDAEKIQNEVAHIINPTKKIKDLEKRLEFSDSYSNRMDLADAYFEIGAYEAAINHYQETLSDTVQDDTYARQQLITAYFQLEDYYAIIDQGEYLIDKEEFQQSKSHFYYGYALYQLGKNELAERHLKAIDRPYSNYQERVELAKFYLNTHQENEGKILLQEIATEADYMTKPNRRLYSKTIQEVQSLLKDLN